MQNAFAHQFEKELVPQEVRDRIDYQSLLPHTVFIVKGIDVTERG